MNSPGPPRPPGISRATAFSEAPPAEARLERSFRPPLGELVSFLVNGLCLIGRHRILEWDARDARVAAALEALGHDVTALEPGPVRIGSALADAPPAGGYDRAMLVSRAFGYLGDEGDRSWLQAARRALRPGGLLLFHVLDRDRAWSLVRDFLAGAREIPGGPEGGAGAEISFDPRSGRVTARIRSGDPSRTGSRPPGSYPAGSRPLAGGRASVRAFHLGEIGGLLEEAGFRLERACGDWQGGALEEAGERTGRILVVASKTRRSGGPARRPGKGGVT